MAKTAQKYLLNDSLYYLAALYARTVHRRLNQELSGKGYKITAEQLSFLVHVWAQGGQTQQFLAEKLYKNKTTMARLISSVESQGLVARKAGKHDGREKTVFITPQGEKIIHKLSEIAQKLCYTNVAKGISEREIALCKDVLRRAHQNVV